MHIILTSNYSPWSSYSGGGQHSTHNLATALSDRGHLVDVVFTKTSFESVSTPANLSYNLHWALLPSLRSKRASWLRNFTIYSVRAKVQSLLKDKTVIHCNGEEGALLGSLDKGHTPFVLTPRYPRIPAEINNPPVSTGQAFMHIKNTKYHLLGKALQSADVCCPTSTFALKMLENHYQFRQAKKMVIPNGVSDKFLEATSKKDLKGPLIFFGRLAYSKGIDTLIDALSILSNPQLKLLIVGRGELKQKLISKAQSLNLKNQITFTSWMDQSEIIGALENASVAVLPSREESFGNTMAEAMATGTPVISTTAGSIPEVVLDGETGLLVLPDDPQLLSEAIGNLLNNESLARSLAENGQSRVRNNFTWDAVAQAYENEYEMLLNG